MNNLIPYDHKIVERFTVQRKCAVLKTNPEQEKTIAGCRDAIDKSNAKAVSLGYKAEQWAILHHRKESIYFANGVLCTSTEEIKFVEVYPPLFSMQEGDILIK